MKPRFAAYLIVAALVLIAAVVFAQGTTQWPMYRHDSIRSGKADTGALPDNTLSPIWVFPVPENGGGSVDNDVLDKSDTLTNDVPNFESTGVWHGGDSDIAPNAYNGNYLYAASDLSSASCTATWKFPLSAQQNSLVAYYVYAWFPSHAYADEKLHATKAQYTVEIVNDDGTVASAETYSIDQSSGGNWELVAPSAFLVRDDQWVRVTLTNHVPEIDRGTIVCADAVRLTCDVGSVLASPAFAPNNNANRDDDLVVTAVTENRPLQTVTTLVPATDEFGNAQQDSNGNTIMTTMTVQSGAVHVGQLYGLYAEKQGSAAVDERGAPKWAFPYSTDNWIVGGFSSSPVIHQLAGIGGSTEAAYCAAEDGQIYVVDTRNTIDGTPNSEQKLIWRGPGYVVEPTTSGAWAVMTRAGRQGADFREIAAVKDGDTESTATWSVTVTKDHNYSIYAWIPPSITSEIGIPDAKYKVTIGPAEYDATADQRTGGRWVLLGKYEAADSHISVEMTNVSDVMKNASAGPRVAFADAIKVVPSELGVFDFSSPAVSADGKRMYAGTTSGRLYCFEIGNPEPVWVYPDPYDSDAEDRGPLGAIYSSPTLSENGYIYFGSADGHVYKVKDNGTSCSEQWVYPKKPKKAGDPFEVFGEISTSIALDSTNGLLYFGVGSDSSLPPMMTNSDPLTGRVVCLQEAGSDPLSGAAVQLHWVYPDPDDPDAEARGSFLYSSPLLFDTGLKVGSTLAIGSTDGYLIGLNRMDGHDLMSTGDWANDFPDLGEAMYSSAAGVMVNKTGIQMPVAYIGTQSGSLKSVDLRNGVKGWSYGLTGAVTSSPAVAEDRLYVGDMSGLTWAFSARAGSGSNDKEDWNYDRLPDGPIGNPEDGDGTNNNESKVEVDVFHRAEWDAVKDGLVLPDAKGLVKDADLHKISRTEKDGIVNKHGQTIPYEWGETVYIIAWDCLDPNDPDDALAKWEKGQKPGTKYASATDSTVRLTIKSRGPGDESDQSTALTMTEKGSFMDKDGKIVYFAKYAYVLGTSSSSSTQAPGSRMTVSVQELPSTRSDSVNKGATAGDCTVPEHQIPTDPETGEYDHKKYIPQLLTINNPLGLAYTDPMTNVSELIGVNSVGSHVYSSSHYANDRSSLAHYNDNRHHVPYVRAGLVAHGTNSDEKVVDVIDRSLLFLTGSRLGKFRVDRDDLEWNGGPDRIYRNAGGVSTFIDKWETKPPLFASGRSDGANTSLDYPDIRMRQLDFTMVESRSDPTQDAATLRPGNGGDPTPLTGDLWTAGTNPVGQVVSVPKHQPANMPSTWPTSNALDLNSAGYLGHSYVFIDSNGDGRLTRGGSLGSSRLYQSSVSGARSEAYRRIHSQVHVPPDYRVDVAEKTYDIGAVPHGFGLTPSGNAAPNLFFPLLGQNVALDLPGGSKMQPLDDNIDSHFKSFTAYNDGNVNIMNIQLARRVKPATGYSYPLDLYSDTTESNVRVVGGSSPYLASYGACIPADGVVSALDNRFLTNDSRNLRPIVPWGDGVSRTFHKPRVGETASVLRMPDLPTRLWGDTTFGFNPSRLDPNNKPDPLIPSLPCFSVAVPVGTPVGTYSRSLTLYEDMNQNGVFDPGESVGNPMMDVKVTVTENRMTDNYLPGARPQIDYPVNGVSIGDVSPAAYVDPNGNLQMFWSSNRYRDTGSAPTAGAPWYLFKSSMPWNASGYWSMASGGSLGSDQWWTPVNEPYPTPGASTLATFFNGGPGDVQLSSVKFSSPSIATLGSASYLFFGGEAVRYKPGATTEQDVKAHEYKAFYWPLDDTGTPTGTAVSSTHDWTMPKYGIRGAGAMAGDPVRPTLWTFWYGGNNSQWRIYYNMSPLKSSDSPGDPASWSNDGRLPLPRGLSSAAEPSIISRRVRERDGDLIGVLEVMYSAYSLYHKNTDIYLTRYEPDLEDVRNGVPSMDIVDLPEIQDEVLVRDPASAIYSSRHVDWNDNHMEVRVYHDPSDPTAYDRVDIGTPTRDSQTHALIYTYSDASDPEQVNCKSLFRSVVIDTEAGTVKFLRDPGRAAVVTATYRPRAYRLTTDGAADTGPCALFDDGPNPRSLADMYPNSFWYPSGWGSTPPETDRLWVFWRRPTTVMKGTSVFYKSFRYTIKLDDQIAKDAYDSIDFGSNQPAGPVEIDWAKKRLYFSWMDEGKTFTVKYPNALGNDVTETHTVQMEEELDAYGNSFGNLTSEVSNEGQVCVVRDRNQYVNKLWVFWTSSRAGNTDIYYETICPRFYARELK